MNDRPQIRVFLLDDHEVVRRGVRELLESEPDIVVVGEADTAATALHRIPRPDRRLPCPDRPRLRWWAASFVFVGTFAPGPRKGHRG